MWCCGSSQTPLIPHSQSERSSPVTCLCSGSCPSSPLLRCILGNPPRPFTSCSFSQNLDSEVFFPGCRVLARNHQDGFYHLGTVVHKIQSCRGLWVVELEPSCRQLVCSQDMVLFCGSGRVRPGDTVLSPAPEFSHRFAPGRVLSSSSDRSGAVWVRVQMWNSCVSLVPLSSVCVMSQNHFHRVTRELLRDVCQSSLCRHGNGITCQSSLCRHGNGITCQSSLCRHGNGITCQSSPCFCCCCCVSNSPSTTLSGLNRTNSGLNRTNSGFTDSGFKDQDTTRTGEDLKTGSSSESLSESRDVPRDQSRAGKQRPPWRYWRRTGAEPNHKKPGSGSRRTSEFHGFPSTQSSSSANHSSVFQPLTNGTRPGSVFTFKPHPPANHRPRSPANHRPRSLANHRPRSPANHRPRSVI